jgi:hypothetical protein
MAAVLFVVTWLFMPAVVFFCGARIAKRLSRGRWLVHGAAVVMALVSLPGGFALRLWLDPSLVEAPGPADGVFLYFFAFAYLIVMIICLVFYGLYAWSLFTSSKAQQA